MSKRSLQKSPNCNKATESSLSLKKLKKLKKCFATGKMYR